MALTGYKLIDFCLTTQDTHPQRPLAAKSVYSQTKRLAREKQAKENAVHHQIGIVLLY